MKVGIVGSRKYQNSRKVKEFIFKLKESFGDELEIVSGEQKDGADGFAKKHALAFGVKYISFPPKHYHWNPYCPNPKFEYNQPYRPYYFFQRNGEIVDYSDVIACFIPPETKISDSHGTYDTYKKALKAGKNIVIIS